MRVAAIVLAAGASTRMGTDKLLLALDGEPLIRRAVRAARDAGCDPTIAVIGTDARAIRAALDDLGVEFVTNADPTTPPGRSFQLGIDQVGDRADAAVLCLGDMVDLSPTMLDALQFSALHHNAAIVLSRYGDVTAPPHLIGRSLFDVAADLPPARLLPALAERFPEQVATVTWPAALLIDIDSPDDLNSVRARRP